ncbi:MAG: hypothetical protein CFE44_11860 [Burkholderiales bacterium PBB4]|nr:MAG: hypothetical protein CFE44_11860 [Burkholderiales bacterium PBB4]
MSSAPIPPAASRDHPLGLTVHSLPSHEDVGQQGQARTRVGRWKMMAVMLVCAAPVIASYFTYYVVRPEGRRNFGELSDPQRSAPDLTAQSLQGKPVKLRSLKGQWLLVSVSGAQCDDMCARHLYLQRQLREGLGKEKDRLDWVWLITDDAPVPEKLLPALKDATVLRVPQTDLAQWLAPQEGHALPEHLYVVDPMTNWMMRFAPQRDDATAVKIKKDLERLLRASASWDQAGR